IQNGQQDVAHGCPRIACGRAAGQPPIDARRSASAAAVWGYDRSMKAGAAVSRAEDVRLAARDAATRALDAAGLDEAACLVVAATPEHLDESIDLCEALRDAAGAGAQIVGGATSAALCMGDAETEEGPSLGVLALDQRAHLFSFRADLPDELRTAALRAGPGALGIVFADPAAPLQRLLAALGREAAKARVA